MGLWTGTVGNAAPLRIGLLPPQDRPSVTAHLKALADELGLEVETLTPEQMVDPAVFNAQRLPVAVYTGSERYLYTVRARGDATQALLRYLREGGFLLVGGFVWPFYRAHDWTGKGYVPSARGPLDEEAILDPWLREQMARLGQTRAGNFNQALGLNIAGAGTMEFESPPETVEFVTNPDQVLFPHLPDRFPFPRGLDSRYRPASPGNLLAGAIATPIVSLVGESGQAYGPGVMLIEHRGNQLAPGTVLYLWGSLLESAVGDRLLRDALRLAAGKVARPSETDTLARLETGLDRLRAGVQETRNLLASVPSSALDLTYFQRQVAALQQQAGRLEEVLGVHNFAVAEARLELLQESLERLQRRVAVLVDAQAGALTDFTPVTYPVGSEGPVRPPAETAPPAEGETKPFPPPRLTATTEPGLAGGPLTVREQEPAFIPVLTDGPKATPPGEARPDQPPLLPEPGQQEQAPEKSPSVEPTAAGAEEVPGPGPEPQPTTPAPVAGAGRPIVVVETSSGPFRLELFEQEAPQTVANFLKLVRAGFYNGLKFHRYVENYVIQGGDPLSVDDNPANDGTGGPGYAIKGEFSPALKHARGMVGMARRPSDPDSAGSQFYICLASGPDVSALDGAYALFGRVVEGMEVVDQLRAGDVMKRVYVEQGAEKTP